MQAQLGQLETSGVGNSKMEVSAEKLPGASLEYIRKVRDMKYHETLFELLSKQYEAARIDEAKQAPAIQVIDRAVVPDRKSGPPRMLLTVAASVLALIASCIWTLVAHAISSAGEVPSHAAGLEQLANALRP